MLKISLLTNITIFCRILNFSKSIYLKENFRKDIFLLFLRWLLGSAFKLKYRNTESFLGGDPFIYFNTKLKMNPQKSRRVYSTDTNIPSRRTISLDSFEELEQYAEKWCKHKEGQLKQKYMFPAFKSIAKVHKFAEIFGKKTHNYLNNSLATCPCCDKFIRVP